MITKEHAWIILGWWDVVKDQAAERGWRLSDSERELAKSIRVIATSSEEDPNEPETSDMIIDGVAYVHGAFEWFDSMGAKVNSSKGFCFKKTVFPGVK